MPKDYKNLDLPAGIKSNGTVYSNRGFWMDGSRIRWHNNAIRPIGGWRKFLTNVGELVRVFANPAIEKARGLLAYKVNNGTAMYVAATNLGLRAWYRGDTAVHDITPADFVPRDQEVVAATGYGMWFYGADAYGTERPSSNLDAPAAFSWCLRNWGENLLAAPRGAPSKLYEWAPSFASPAVVVTNAPVDFDCFTVTNERIVMVAGQPDNPRLVQWSDSEDNTNWDFADRTTQSGFQTLDGTGRFRDIVSVQGRYLLVSETDAYLATYLGPPYIYTFRQVGEECGTIAPNSVVSTETFAMWPGRNCFFLFDGTAVRRIECDVMDRFAKAINASQETKTMGFVNSSWSEIWWLYQEGGGDVDSYIVYNWVRKDWTVGKLDRSAAFSNDAVGGLVMMGTDGYAYNHELEGVAPFDDDQSEVFLESGPIELTNGNTTQYISGIIGDYLSEGKVAITIIGQDFPSGPETTFGPYTLEYPAQRNQAKPVRARGHTIRYRIEGLESTWVQGSVRLNFQRGGQR